MTEKKRKSGFKLIEYFQIFIGTMITGFGSACFITPAKVVSGGVSGLSTIGYHLTGYDAGVIIIILSIPLYILGIRVFGKKYGILSMIGNILFSLWVTFFGQLTSYAGFLDYSSELNVFLSSVFGGVIYGGGIGLVMRTGANTGGTDIIAQIISKYTFLSTGTALFIVDSVVIILGGFVFGFERALISLVNVFVTSEVINFVVTSIGTSYAKTAYIFSERTEEIGKRIISELHHGGTVFVGKGIFTGSERKMLMAVAHRRQISVLSRIVHEEDPNAFMTIQDTYMALGEGFSSIQSAYENLISKGSETSPVKSGSGKKNGFGNTEIDKQ